MAGWRKSRKWDRGTQERQEQGLRQLKKEGYWEPSRLELGFVHVLSGISEEQETLQFFNHGIKKCNQIFIYLFSLCVYTRVLWVKGQCEKIGSLFTMWLLGIKHRLSGWAVGAFLSEPSCQPNHGIVFTSLGVGLAVDLNGLKICMWAYRCDFYFSVLS